MRPTLILGPDGKPAGLVQSRLGVYFDNVERSRSDSRPVFRQQNLGTFEEVINWAQLKKIISLGRHLFANSSIVRGALRDMAKLSFPLTPRYYGEDQDWGRSAKDWLLRWHRDMTTHGRQFNFDRCCKLVLNSVFTDGDIGTFKTKIVDKPVVTFYRAHQISGDNKSGFKLGVRRTAAGRPSSYRVEVAPKKFREIGAARLFLTFEPEMPNQSRGLSRLATPFLDFADLRDLRQYELRAHMLASTIALTERRVGGAPENADPALDFPASGTTTSGTASGLVTQTLEEGAIRYYEAGDGSGIEAFNYNRPGADAVKFQNEIIVQALYALGWDPNFALAIQTPSGAFARAIIEKIRRTVIEIQELISDWALQVDIYGLSVAIDNGEIPAPANGDVWSWQYHGPARITADSGNEARIKNESFVNGTCTLEELSMEKGVDWRDLRRQRAIESRQLLDLARELASEYPELDFHQALKLLQNNELQIQTVLTANQQQESE